jgi:hypothetical protein
VNAKLPNYPWWKRVPIKLQLGPAYVLSGVVLTVVIRMGRVPLLRRVVQRPYRKSGPLGRVLDWCERTSAAAWRRYDARSPWRSHERQG